MTNTACQQIKTEFQQNEAVCGHVLDLFQLISNKARFRIICMLTQGEFCVQDIVDTIEHGGFSNVSQQLRILTLANLVQRRRVNRQVLYSLKDQRLTGLIDYLRKQFLERTPEI